MTQSHIVACGNTLIPAVLALESKGYRVSWTRLSDHEENWNAEGPLGTFAAEGPEEVLGLVAMREVRGEDWKAPDAEIDAFLKRYDTG
jgi:hypothetical protein